MGRASYADYQSVTPALTKAMAEHKDPYAPFLPLLAHSTNHEDPIPLLTSTVLTSLISASAHSNPKGTPAADRALPKLLSYLSTLAKSPDGGLQDIAVLEYSSLLRGKKSRELFWEQRKETIEPLIGILRTAAGVGPNGEGSNTLWNGVNSSRPAVEGVISGGVGLQLLYHILLVMWQMSFEGAEIGDGLEE
jgi:V-type H+-transporting ATPase subunit H